MPGMTTYGVSSSRLGGGFPPFPTPPGAPLPWAPAKAGTMPTRTPLNAVTNARMTHGPGKSAGAVALASKPRVIEPTAGRLF